MPITLLFLQAYKMNQFRMEFWERDFEWLKVRHIVKDAMKKDSLPDLQTVLFLIGVQELGRIPKTKFTKIVVLNLVYVQKKLICKNSKKVNNLIQLRGINYHL